MARTISTKLELTGEAEYRAKLKNINAELALQKSELEKVQAQYKNSANSMEALSAKETALNGQIAALNEKYREQSAMLDKAREAYQRYAAQVEELEKKQAELAGSSEDTSEEQKKLQEEIDAAKASMQKAANSVTYYQKQLNATERDQYKLGNELKRTEQYLDEAKASADSCAHSIDQYGKEVKQAGDSSEQFGRVSKEAVNQLAAALAAAGIAKSVKEIADALMDSVDAFAAFQAQMSAVRAISGASGEEMDALAEKARLMGSTTAFTAEEAGQALEYMAMAGWKTGDMLDGLEGVMNLAAASGESLSATSDIITDALTAFGLAAQDGARFADVLAAASSNSNTNVAMMGETFKYAAPVAGALGYSIEDTALAIGLMANAGIKGSQAGSALRSTLTNLAKPSKEVSGYLEELGVSLTDNEGKTRSLSELLDVLRDRFADLTEAEKAEYAAGIAGKEAMSGLLAIVNAGEADYLRLRDAIAASSGAAKEMSEIRLDNFQGQMTLLSSAADGLKLAIGEQLTPVLTRLVEAGTDAFTWATEFVSENEWVVSAIAGLTGALGALVVGVGALAAAPAIIGALNTALGLLSANPAALVVSAIVGLTAAVATWAASVDDTDESVKKFTESLQESKQAYEDLMDAMGKKQGSTKATADALKDLLAVEGKSAVQKAEILALIEQLNEAVPGLNLAYDEEKDALVGLTEAEVESAIERAAAQEKYQADMERLAELRTEGAQIAQNLKDAETELAEAQAENGQGFSSYSEAAMYYGNAIGYVGWNIGDLEGNVQSLTDSLDANRAEIAALEEETSAYSEQQATAAEKVSAMTTRVDELIADMENLSTTYEESYDAAYEGISGAIGLFNEMDASASTSIDNLIGALESQVAYMDTYAANIQRAMELGIDQGLLAKLSDGSQESAQYLDAIAKGGEEKVAELNEQFAKVEEGKKTFSDTVAQMETDFDKKMGEMVDDLEETIKEMDLYDQTKKVALDNLRGLIDGSSDPALRKQLRDQYTLMGQENIAAYKAAVDQHSPSKKFAKAGANDIQGLIEGAESKRASLSAAYESLARTAMESYAAGVQNNLEAVAEAMDQFDAALKDLDSFYGLRADVGDLEYQLWERTDGKNASEAEKYARQLELLNQQQADQEEKVKAAAAVYETAVELYGEGAQGSYEYQKALLQEQLALQDLLDEINEVNAARQQMYREQYKQQAELNWQMSGVGRASAVALAQGYITPQEVAQIANIGIVSPEGYERAVQDVMYSKARHLPSTLEEPRAVDSLGRQMEAMTAGVINAVSDMARNGGAGTERVRIITVDGKVLAEASFDDLVDYGDANGTPILNGRR